MLAKQNDYLKAAIKETEKINLDEKLKYAYLMRQLELMDEATQKKSYYEEGKTHILQLVAAMANDNLMDESPRLATDESFLEEMLQRYKL